MASVMAIEHEVLISCVEGIRIEVGVRDIEDCFGALCGLAMSKECRERPAIGVSRGQWCQVLEADLLAYWCD